MRASGILLPIFSLPSPYGIGTIGKEAYEFVDFLVSAKQRYWQILPLGPTGYGDSPYQSFCSFACNSYLIDLDILEEKHLLQKDEYINESWYAQEDKVDYGLMYQKEMLFWKKLLRDLMSIISSSKLTARKIPTGSMIMQYLWP